jgi:hypothetical protein
MPFAIFQVDCDKGSATVTLRGSNSGLDGFDANLRIDTSNVRKDTTNKLLGTFLMLGEVDPLGRDC